MWQLLTTSSAHPYLYVREPHKYRTVQTAIKEATKRLKTRRNRIFKFKVVEAL